MENDAHEVFMYFPVPVPVSIDYEYERPPWATIGLVAANVLVWLWTLGAEDEAVLALALQTDDFALHPLITSCFLHVGGMHLLVNMIGLAVFGRYVEARVGWRNTVLLYLACGLGGSLAFLLETSVAYDVPRGVLGASGAISGLMGFTLVAAPKAEIRVFMAWFGNRMGSEVPAFPAWFALGAWILWQLLLYVAAGPYLGTAFSAHFGGLLAGAGLAFLMHAKVMEGTPFHMERAPLGGSMDEARRRRTAERWRKIAEERRARRLARKTAQAEAREAKSVRHEEADIDLPPVPPAPLAPLDGEDAWGTYDDPPAPDAYDDDPIDLPPASR